eukprot:tig00000391_g24864.t1
MKHAFSAAPPPLGGLRQRASIGPAVKSLVQHAIPRQRNSRSSATLGPVCEAGGARADAAGQQATGGSEASSSRKVRAARNFYSGSPLERAAHLRTDREWARRAFRSERTRVLPMWGEAVAVLGPSASERAAEPILLPGGSEALRGVDPLAEDASVFFLGIERRSGEPLLAVDFQAAGLPPPFPPPEPRASRDPDHVALKEEREARFAGLRSVGPMLADDDDAAALAYATGIVAWARRSRHCSRCGAPAAMKELGFMRQCTDAACGAKEFPRTDPAVIMLVTSGEYCLLGRKAAWAPQRYSTLAGFMEPGETFEEAVARETLEEAGVRVCPSTVRYHSSQPWPFPASLMVGFYAEVPFEGRDALRTEVDEEEMEDVRWFHRRWLLSRVLPDRFPPDSDPEADGEWAGDHPDLDRFAIPGRASLARRLILDWLLPGDRDREAHP